MKRLITTFCFLLFTVYAIDAQIAIGSWRAHLSYHNTTQSAPAGNIVYALSNGALFSYDKEDSSIRLYNKVNLLSDNNIAYIAYNKTFKILLIIYTNSNIDLLINDDEVYNIPDYKNKDIAQDKTVNSIFFDSDYAYLSTNFGILILNLKKKEISNTYTLNKKVTSSVVYNQTIYAATDEGIYSGKTANNLLDTNNWELINYKVINKLLLFENTLIGNILNDGIYKYDLTTNSINRIITGNYSFINTFNDKLIAGNTQVIAIFNHVDSYNYITINDSLLQLSYDGNTFWGSCGSYGLKGFKYNSETNKLETIYSSIIPNSPIRNLPYYMTFTNNRLLVCGGGMGADRYNNPGTIMMFENESWTNFQEEGIVDKTGVQYKDITSIIQDPRDPEHYFASSGGEGLYEFTNIKFTNLYNLNNSILASALPEDNLKQNYVRTNGLQYDNNNNLWMVNSEVTNIINILKSDGKWINLYYSDIANIPTFERILFDKRGWAWLTSMRYKPGIFCLNTNSTLEDTSDDKTKFISSFTNQDGISLGELRIYCITEDKDGYIWIGTEKGPLVIYNPTTIFDDNFYCTQIKVPRNDNTNYADFLLSSEKVNAICVDGVNRKWIGTQNNGIFLLSEDGLGTIYHFNIDNSPLLSNTIQSIVINPFTGEIFIGTSNGLISYKSDATEAEKTFSETAHAFPNPVRPDYTGLITITGLIRDSNIKITDVNGNLIKEGTSIGGQFTWNGKKSNGKRVASGIYFVLASNSEGKEGIATKILIIK